MEYVPIRMALVPVRLAGLVIIVQLSVLQDTMVWDAGNSVDVKTMRCATGFTGDVPAHQGGKVRFARILVTRDFTGEIVSRNVDAKMAVLVMLWMVLAYVHQVGRRFVMSLAGKDSLGKIVRVVAAAKMMHRVIDLMVGVLVQKVGSGWHAMFLVRPVPMG